MHRSSADRSEARGAKESSFRGTYSALSPLHRLWLTGSVHQGRCLSEWFLLPIDISANRKPGLHLCKRGNRPWRLSRHDYLLSAPCEAHGKAYKQQPWAGSKSEVLHTLLSVHQVNILFFCFSLTWDKWAWQEARRCPEESEIEQMGKRREKKNQAGFPIKRADRFYGMITAQSGKWLNICVLTLSLRLNVVLASSYSTSA